MRSILTASLELFLLCVASSSWAYVFIRRQSEWQFRLLFSVPPIAVFAGLPFLFDFYYQPNLRTITAAVVTWWSTFKLLAFAFHVGPLANANTFMRFSALLFLPIVVQSRSVRCSTSGTATQLCLRAIAKFIGVLLLIYIDSHHWVHPFIIYSGCIYLVARYLLHGVQRFCGFAFRPAIPQPFTPRLLGWFPPNMRLS